MRYFSLLFALLLLAGLFAPLAGAHQANPPPATLATADSTDVNTPKDTVANETMVLNTATNSMHLLNQGKVDAAEPGQTGPPANLVMGYDLSFSSSLKAAPYFALPGHSVSTAHAAPNTNELLRSSAPPTPLVYQLMQAKVAVPASAMPEPPAPVLLS